jgi:toxin ParE1/3/4
VKFKVNILQNAEDDLFEIYKYVNQSDSEQNAENLFQKLHKRCLQLQEYAERGHVLSELALLDINDFLEIHFKPYRIIYQIIKKEVFIHCVLDGRRDIQKLLQERLLR